MTKNGKTIPSLAEAYDISALRRLASMVGLSPDRDCSRAELAQAISDRLSAAGVLELFDGLGSEEIYWLDRLVRARKGGQRDEIPPAGGQGIQSLASMGLTVYVDESPKPGAAGGRKSGRDSRGSGIRPTVPDEIARAYISWKTGRKVFRLTDAMAPARPAPGPPVVHSKSGDPATDLLALLLMVGVSPPRLGSKGGLTPADVRRFLGLAGHAKEDFVAGPGEYLVFLMDLAEALELLCRVDGLLVQGPGAERFLAADTERLLLACHDLGAESFFGEKPRSAATALKPGRALPASGLPASTGLPVSQPEHRRAPISNLYRRIVSVMFRYPPESWIPLDAFETEQMVQAGAGRKSGIHSMITGFFHYFGYCDIGSDRAGRAICLRVTASGRQRLFGGTDDSGAAPLRSHFARSDQSGASPPLPSLSWPLSETGASGARVGEDFSIRLAPDSSKARVYALSTFAEPVALRPFPLFTLTKESVLRAFSAGSSPKDLLAFLTAPGVRSDFGRIPDKVAGTISEWWNLYGDATILSGNFLLAADEGTMKEIMGSKALSRRIARQISPQVAALKDGDLQRIGALLSDRGFMPRTEKSGLPFMPGAPAEVRREAATALVFAATTLSSLGRPSEVLARAVGSILATLPGAEKSEVVARGTEMADNLSIRLDRPKAPIPSGVRGPEGVAGFRGRPIRTGKSSTTGRDGQKRRADGQPMESATAPEAIEAAMRIIRQAAERKLPMRVRVLEPGGESSTVREVHGPYDVTKAGGLMYLHAFTRLFQEKVTLRIDRILFIETLGL